MKTMTIDDAIIKMRKHREADKLMKGLYWNGRKGCAIGCLTHDKNGGHEELAKQIGIPEWALRLVDLVFEKLPEPEHLEWPVAFLEAARDFNGDWQEVQRNILLWILDGLVYDAKQFHEVHEAVERVKKLWRESATPDEAELAAARADASRSFRAASGAAFWAAYGAAFWAASEADSWVVAEAAVAASWADDDADDVDTFWRKLRDRLLGELGAREGQTK